MTVEIHTEPDGQSAEFAAGVAAATSVAAAEDAAEAGQIAEQAEQRAQNAERVAEMAVETAGVAATEAYDARAAVEGLRAELLAALDTRLPATAVVVEDQAADETAPAPGAEDQGQPGAGPKTEEPKPAGGTKKKRGGWWS